MPKVALSLAALLALAPAASAQETSFDGVEVAQLVLHQRIIIRIPRLSGPPARSRRAERAAAAAQTRWTEKRGPKCVPLDQLVGAQIGPDDSIDLTLADGGTPVRAVLADECRALDYYSGFYLKPTRDGMVCAKRDAFRMRSGGACGIKGFRTLVARR